MQIHVVSSSELGALPVSLKESLLFRTLDFPKRNAGSVRNSGVTPKGEEERGEKGEKGEKGESRQEIRAAYASKLNDI